MKVVLLPQAEEGLDPIFDPVLPRGIRRLRLLGRCPEMGARMLGHFDGYRSRVVDMFRIVYRVSARTVDVAYIRDCRRAPLY
ncbi:MAG: type II toxin-antitoxin system RelE/ParE family toxin [bacterium]